MSNEQRNTIVLIAIGLAVMSLANRHEATKTDVGETTHRRWPGWFDNVDVQLVKIDLFARKLHEQQRQISDMLEASSRAHSQPLRDADLISSHKFSAGVDSPLLCEVCGLAQGDGIHIAIKPTVLTVPLVETNLSTPPPAAVTPGMEPAKDPPKSRPVVVAAQPVKASGRWESRGLLGRRRIWVTDQRQVYRQYEVQAQPQQQRSGVPVLRRFGSCRGGSCGG